MFKQRKPYILRKAYGTDKYSTMVEGHKIQQKIPTEEFLERLEQYTEEQIEVTQHTVFRLNEAERKFYKEERLKDMLLAEKPVLVGLQKNGNYAAFYRHGKERLKMILDLQPKKIVLVTFFLIDTEKVPRL